MRQFILQVYDADDGARIVKMETSIDLAVGIFEAMRVLTTLSDVPPGLRNAARQWVAGFQKFIGDDYNPPVIIKRGPAPG